MKLNAIYSSLSPSSSSTMSNATANNAAPNPSSSSGTLKKFHLFPKLPTELRLKIYDAILDIAYTPSPPSAAQSKQPWDPTIRTTKRILKISFEPGLGRYVSNTPPPILLAICAEGRAHALSASTCTTKKQYSFLSLGPSLAASTTKSKSNSHSHLQTTKDVEIDTRTYSLRPTRATHHPLPIPVSFATDTLYISTSLPAPLFSTHVNDLLFYLSTSPSRHRIVSLAFDLRIWGEMTENGAVGILAGMRALREVLLVVEFGRREFGGELGFLEQPEWRGDLRWVGDKAETDLKMERERRGRKKVLSHVEGEVEKEVDVSVRCVLLTRGGEQA